MSALPSSRKTHSERHKQIFRQLLKELPNKLCADCKTATHPRWASWNLGCFVCIRCSGIHRLMGTHILRVKSVDLDAWTDEQVELMVKWGNAKCNAFWEAKLPDNYVPDALKIENFIRTKYDLKKWAAAAHVPDPMAMPAPLGVKTASATSIPAPAARRAAPPTAASKSESVLLDDDFGSFTLSPRATPAPVPPVQHLVLAPPPAPRTAQAARKDQRTDLKKSILSLYSSPQLSTSSVQQTHVPPSYQASPTPSASNSPAHSEASANSVADSLLGLNLGAPARAAPAAVPAKVPSLWSNEWNESSLSVNQWAEPSYNGTTSSTLSGFSGTFAPASAPVLAQKDLDDDLFKNVWS